MKKIFLLSILFFQITFAFGQKILGESNEMINYDTEWGNWTSIPGVSNVLFSSKLKWYDKVKNSYGWEIRWKATRTPIYFEYKIPNIIFKSYENVVQENGGWFNTVLSNQNQATGGYGIDCTSKTTVLIQVRNVCFEFEGGNPKCNKTNASSNQSNNSNNNSTNQTNNSTQQNDLSEYNRSKADLERQMAEKNAEAQREANRINNQRKQFINVYNEGADLQRSGNFEGAKGKYQQAIGLATNEAERQKAQSSYDNMAKTVKDAVVYNVVGEGLKQIGSTLDKVHNDKMKKIQDEIDDSKRKRKIIDEDKVVNTLNNPKIFETYCDYVVKNLEELNFKFENIYIYNNIPNEKKEVFLNFKGLQVIIDNYWISVESGMMKRIHFKAENENAYKTLDKSNLIESLKNLDPFYNDKHAKLLKNEISLFTYGLEKTQPYIDVYNNGYKSENYKGFFSLLGDFQNQAKLKLEKTDSSYPATIEKVRLYQSGLQGIEKNYQKALEICVKAYDNSKNIEYLHIMGDLYKEGDKFLPKNYVKAEEFYLKYLQNNDKTNPYVYISLAEIYKDKTTSLYNIIKAEEVLQRPLKSLEQEFNSEKIEELKSKLSYYISRIYSDLAYLNRDKKNPYLFAEYSEKVMQWNEDDYFTASALVKLYALGKLPYERDSYGFRSDKKKAKLWANKLTEIVNRLERKDSESNDAKVSKVYLEMLKKEYGKFF